MSERSVAIEEFLSEHGYRGANRKALSGDASTRRYERIFPREGDRTLILMDAPAETCEPLDAFVDVAKFLEGIRLSAPRIYEVDRKQGLMLLEDFGDDLVARFAERNPDAEAEIYDAAVDLLVEMQSHAPADILPHYSPETQAELSALAVDWYRRHAVGAENAVSCRDRLKAVIENSAASIMESPVFVHRDYHAENLVWLPKREGARRLGMLDFQDGSVGNPAYDLVSLLEDARRDLGSGIRARSTRRYCEATGIGAADAERQLAICGAQRNLRIVGVFARLAIRDGKPWYLDLLPRVWRNLELDLCHPVNARLNELVREILPPPDAGILDALRRATA